MAAPVHGTPSEEDAAGRPSAGTLSARTSRATLPARLASSGSLLRASTAPRVVASLATTASLAARSAGSAGRGSSRTASKIGSIKGSASAASTAVAGGSSASTTWSRRSSTSCSSCTGTRSSTTTRTSSGTSGRSSSGTNASTATSGDTSRATYSDSRSTASRRSIGTIEEEDDDHPEGRRSWSSESLPPGRAGKDAEVVAVEERSPSTPSWTGSEADWDEEKWLLVAARHDAQRRTTTTAGWEACKAKFPELFRSDVSICPSYTQFQVPYWSVCRQRHIRTKRRINRRLAEDIEELALLQTRALDGVRVVRCFSLGARPQPPPVDQLTERQRRRVEQLVSG